MRRKVVAHRVIAFDGGLILLGDYFVIELAADFDLGKDDDGCHLVAKVWREFIRGLIPDLDAIRADGNFFAIWFNGVRVDNSLLGTFAIEVQGGLPVPIDPLLGVDSNHPLTGANEAGICLELNIPMVQKYSGCWGECG